MNRRTLASLLFGVSACPIACAQAVWKLATGYRADSFHTRNLDLLSRDVGQATNGALRIELKAAGTAEQRGWAASEAAAGEAVEQLRRNGIKIERASAEVLMEIKILGERFSLEWVRQVVSEANSIFIPYFTHS